MLLIGPTHGSTKAGYVALAVDSDKVQRKVEFDTESDDRNENMIEFGRLGLTLLLEVIQGASKWEKWMVNSRKLVVDSQ